MKSVIYFFLIGFVLLGSSAADAQDSPPKLLAAASYQMPQAAMEAGFQGRAVIAVNVDESGKVTKAALIAGPMFPCGTAPTEAYKLLSTSLEEKMKTLTYSPGIKNGKPAEMAFALTLDLKNPTYGAKADIKPEVDPATGKILQDRIHGGVLNGKAKELPKPAYPVDARMNRDAGNVKVDVLVDETGKVLVAGAVSGPPRLQFASREAACGAKFTPTTLQGRPVKVMGTIEYNFIP